MFDFKIYDPANFTTEELTRAARGEAKEVKPQLAVSLLQAKLGDDAEKLLLELACSDTADPRARHANGRLRSLRHQFDLIEIRPFVRIALVTVRALNSVDGQYANLQHHLLT